MGGYRLLLLLVGMVVGLPVPSFSLNYPSTRVGGALLLVGELAARLETRTQEFVFHASETPRACSRVLGP